MNDYILKIADLSAGYGDLAILHNIELEIKHGEKVALIGPNGAGKSTLIKVIGGLIKPLRGDIYLQGVRINDLSPHERTRLGIAIVPEGGRIFPKLTVYENLIISAKRKDDVVFEEVFELFPVLKERKNQIAGTLSGGEQRMLAIARALVLRPKLLIIDELSLGLAPKIINDIYNALLDLWEKTRMSLLITEQYVKKALEFSDRAYVIEGGSIVLKGDSKELIKDPRIVKAYLTI
jgi:branched-chain amino acid transport system ATP-binding protein